MNCATQIVESNYDFIIKQCRLIKKGSALESGDLAHDAVEKILKMDKANLDRLLQNPKGFIRTMLVNSDLDQKRKVKVRERFRLETLYSRKRHDEQQVFLPESLSNDPQELSAKIAKIKNLTEIEQILLSVFIVYPDISSAANKLQIKWHTVAKYKKLIFEKLK